MCPGTDMKRYGMRSTYNTNWIYPDLVDVKFDHRPNEISRGHFTHTVEILITTKGLVPSRGTRARN